MSQLEERNTRSPYLGLIQALSEDISTVFGNTTQAGAMQRKCSEAMDELQAYASGRNLSSTCIAVLGAKNTGKSWFCRLFVNDVKGRSSIQTGETSQFSTEKATWIGVETPHLLDTEYETRITMQSGEMVDLGLPYTLLDLPGFNDATIPAREAALKALRGVSLRVFVVSSSVLADESQYGFLENSDGTRILPLVIDEDYPRFKEEGRKDVESMVERIQRHCPRSTVLKPIVIPHTKRAVGDSEEHERFAKEAVIDVLRGVLSEQPADDNAIGRAVEERLRRDLACDLRSFRERVFPALKELIEEENDSAADLVQQLLGSDLQIQSILRIRMRILAQSIVPGWLFPFKGLLGLLVMTAGAWDRLAFSMAGSLPSLVALIFQGTKNAKDLNGLRTQTTEALEARLETLANDRLLAKNRIFSRAISESLLSEPSQNEKSSQNTRFVGLSRIVEESQNIFDKIIQSNTRGPGEMYLWGGLATAAFFGILSGPLASIYAEFIRAWSTVFTDAVISQWQEFPAPSFGMLFTSLFLAILPVLFCAQIYCIRMVSKGQIDRAIADVKAKHHAMLERLAEEKAVRLVTDDPVREAVRNILDFISTTNTK